MGTHLREDRATGGLSDLEGGDYNSRKNKAPRPVPSSGCPDRLRQARGHRRAREVPHCLQGVAVPCQCWSLTVPGSLAVLPVG